MVTDLDLDCIMGIRCTSSVLRAKSCEKTVSCQFDVLASGQMDTQLLTSSKIAQPIQSCS